jgi:hypothetical protein
MLRLTYTATVLHLGLAIGGTVERLTKHYSHAQIKDDETGGTRGMYRKQKKLIQGCGGET